MIVYECPYVLDIKILKWSMVVVLVLAILVILLMREIIIAYKDMEVQNKVLKQDLELNTILKHEHIQKMLCPYDLIDFNNEHVYSCDKCSICNKQCKKECWKQYFIDKLKEKKIMDSEKLSNKKL